MEPESAAAGVAVRIFIAVVFRLDVDHGRAVWAFALVLILEIRIVVFGVGKLGQSFGLGGSTFTVLAGLADKSIAPAPWGIGKRGPVGVAAHANIVFVADDVAVMLPAAGAFGAAGHPVPGPINALCVQAFFRSGYLDIGQAVSVRLAVPTIVPDALMAAARALGPLAGNFRNQNLGVFAHGVSPCMRGPPI